VERPLNPDEAALWARVMTTVRPLGRPAVTAPVTCKEPPPPRRQLAPAMPVHIPAAAQPHDQRTLDGGWDRRLSRGIVSPDSSIDLHGHTLDRAYARIDFGLETAIQRGDRVVLLVTGKPRAEGVREGRGAIRAVISDWLAASRHASAIAAVRPAHPRHGGAGALYLILRRRG
jgi:DNA-nicking Smr family endonuclease